VQNEIGSLFGIMVQERTDFLAEKHAQKRAGGEYKPEVSLFVSACSSNQL
jgi:hypothetical protein